MANGLLSEIRRLAESSKDIPQEVVNRLMLSALAELVVKVDKHTEVEETKNQTFDDALDNMRAISADLSKQVSQINDKLTFLTGEIEKIRSNPFVSLGGFIKRHPKSSVMMMVVVIAAMIILFSSRPFIVLLLTILGVPNDAIEQILILIS